MRGERVGLARLSLARRLERMRATTCSIERAFWLTVGRTSTTIVLRSTREEMSSSAHSGAKQISRSCGSARGQFQRERGARKAVGASTHIARAS